MFDVVYRNKECKYQNCKIYGESNKVKSPI